MASSGDLFRLDASQIARASEILARAFWNDPLVGHLMPEPGKRELLLSRSFRFVTRLGIRCGEVYASSPDLEGIAVWIAPGASHLSLAKMVRAGILPLAFSMGWTSARRLYSFHRQMDRLWAHRAPAPHWYLMALGVAPEHQKKGHGSRLLREMLCRLDQENLPCRLETGTGENEAFYRRHGFETVERGTIQASSVRFSLMIRAPSAGVSTPCDERKSHPHK